MKYKNARDFRKALESRIRNLSQQRDMPHIRLRKLIAFDRFLARLTQSQLDNWVLKGGFALQLRLGDRARTTKDIDLLSIGEIEVLSALQKAGYSEIGDWFSFEVTPSAESIREGTKSRRYMIRSRLDGRAFENFHVDVGVGDPIVGKIELLDTPALLSFAGIEQTRVPCYPVTQQIAEKLHAYTRPRSSGISSRVKDFVDILLLAELREIEISELKQAVQATFEYARTHDLPDTFPPPPKEWGQSYRQMIRSLDIDHISLDKTHFMLQQFLNPVLEEKNIEARWNPTTWIWE